MTETQLGRKWAAKMKRLGKWVQKLPASTMAGLPDYMLGGSMLWFVEAKRRYGKRVAFKPSQVTKAQQHFLDQVVRHGGRAALLVLDQDGYVLFDWKDVRPPSTSIMAREFDELKESYHGE